MLLSHEILKRLWLLQIVQKKLISFKEEAHHQQSHIIKFRLFIYLFFAGRCPREKLTELLNEYYQITASVIKSQKKLPGLELNQKRVCHRFLFSMHKFRTDLCQAMLLILSQTQL